MVNVKKKLKSPLELNTGGKSYSETKQSNKRLSLMQEKAPGSHKQHHDQ